MFKLRANHSGEVVYDRDTNLFVTTNTRQDFQIYAKKSFKL